ncbi:MAG: histidine--tRNA ligase [Oscillospiraceae bacterium]|nr:histidine--tRNA ligase [Oscillospiraceae bacterium]
MRKNTVKGTNDYLPGEAAIRDYLQNAILQVYLDNGFERVMTPAVEDIENLDKSEGGENLNLIFRILKRGEKLHKSIEESKFDQLADLGLRYDLTLPLSRYYANNRDKLSFPLKCIQIDKVYRAERPQKGRLRELVQCDIDIVGSSSINCEIELIHVTAKALLAIGIRDFKVRVNDRRILLAIFQSIGFTEEQTDSVCISFDKLATIGVDGVENELKEKGFLEPSVERFVELIADLPCSIEKIKTVCPNREAAESVEAIVNCVDVLSAGDYTIEFDLSLVRGQGYYTGTVFEIESRDFNSSIAGGGRYDNLIGKFLNESVPAVGFSIGFERIFQIMSERKFTVPGEKKRIVVLYDGDFQGAYKEAENLRKDYTVALYEKPNKIGKLLSKLQDKGFYGYYICGQSTQVNEFK